MPRKSEMKVEAQKFYIKDGKLNVDAIFKHQPKQWELLRRVSVGGHPYVLTAAPQMLSVGGIRSGKTSGAMMYGVMNYCMKYRRCDMLVLRRTFKDLESGAINDFKAFLASELYDYDSTKHVATLRGTESRVVFGHCNNLKEKDIAQYLGQAYPFILVDECGQFSSEAWLLLVSRNTLNAGCEPDEFGNKPIPCIWGCTNPIGPFYEFYRTLFVQKEPWNKPEDAKLDKTNGTWWVPEAGTWRLIYDPKDYAFQRSTVLDNPIMMERDPGLITRLNAMPKAKRDKFLFGLDGRFEGQAFDCWSEEYHTVNLREDPEAIIFQYYQPVWAGQDWGRVHSNATYLFTKALVRTSVGTDYKLKTVCFQELVVTGKTYRELASLLAAKAKYPNGQPCEIKYLFFSHEKFAKQMDTHAPVVDYSKELRKYGLPAATPATRDRIGSMSLMYNLLKNGELVILDYCREIILAIPSLMRDPDLLEDVLKTDSKQDDAYDGFRYGLYGMLSTKSRPTMDLVYEHAKTLDPIAQHFFLMKKRAEQENYSVAVRQPERPVWMGKMENL